MRVDNAEAIKSGRRNGRTHDYPKAGSELRRVADMFLANRDAVIAYVPKTKRIVDDLIDYYGLDIRRVGRGKYRLVGEWFGKVYIDYTKEAEECARSES